MRGHLNKLDQFFVHGTTVKGSVLASYIKTLKKQAIGVVVHKGASNCQFAVSSKYEWRLFCIIFL